MSTRDDARLTAQERAALSHLEALATADDPQLAARLRGPSLWLQVKQKLARLPGLPPWVGSYWLAAAAVVVGLALTVLSVGAGLAVGVVGAGVAGAGLWSAASKAERRWGHRNQPPNDGS